MASDHSPTPAHLAKTSEKPFEIFSLIWLDPNSNIQGTRNAEERLRASINNLRKFQEVQPCQQYIEASSDDDRLVLVVSGQLGEQIVPQIDALRQVIAVYVFCMRRAFHEKWALPRPKVKGVFDDIDALISKVKDDQKDLEKVEEPLPFNVFTIGGDPGESTTGLSGRFVFFQVLIDCLLRLKYTDADKAELIKCCQKEYEGNDAELLHLREFQKSYDPKRVLWWYTRETFFYKAINSALRKQNTHMIFLVRKYIADVHAGLSKEQSTSPLKVYRCQMMTTKERKTLQRSIGQLISINSFFSASRDRSRALRFLKPSRATSDLEPVLFEIDAKPNPHSTKPFADISRHSDYPIEAEVLFMIGSIFHLESIHRNDANIWMIKMTLSDDEENSLKAVLVHMKEQLRTEETSLRSLGKVLWRMGQFAQAEKYLLRLLQELQPDDPSIGTLYGELAELASLQEHFDQSLYWHKKALERKSSKKNESEPAKPNKPHSPPEAFATPSIKRTGSEKRHEYAVKGPVASGDNDEDVLQYVTRVMQKALAKPPPAESLPQRAIGNVENFTALAIDQHGSTHLAPLRPLINFTRSIDHPDALSSLLRTCADEKIITIVPLDQAQALLSELSRRKCIHSIYLLSSQTRQPSWILANDKIAGVYRSVESIRDHLATVLPPSLPCGVPVEIASKANDTTDTSFTYCQLLKETMLCEDEESNLKKDMLAFCRRHYEDNAAALREIDDFDKASATDDYIRWFTRSSFVTKILWRAFRTQEIDLLFKMRHFLQSLHKQIQTLASKESVHCYAVLDIDDDTVMARLRDSVNGLLLFRSFVLATKERPKKQKRGSVLFSIRLGSGCAAHIEKYRSSGCEFDVLVNLDTVFRVTSMDKSDNGGYMARLQSVPNEDAHFQQLTSSMRKDIKVNVVILQLTRLTRRNDHYQENDRLLESIYLDHSFEGDRTLMSSLAAAHHMMGNINEGMKDYEGARRHYFKSLRSFMMFLPPNHSKLSASYNNTGSMFYREDLHDEAIRFHQMALQCQLKGSDPDMDAVAIYSANIGAVYTDRKQYSDAIKHLKRAVTIRDKMSSKEKSKTFIGLLQQISKCYWKTERIPEALEHYKKTLSLQLSLPEPADQPLSVTYYNLSTAHERLGEFDKAIDCAERSVECLKRISPSHPELKDNMAQLESVRKKKWLREVLAD